ncbi:MAG: DUF305 domain-containing protein [Candidatus Leucobacter sulfamidivorax]|nr:DUF305 domain-containing protein [Candidatus Leucobacter sulfamidivorax]
MRIRVALTALAALIALALAACASDGGSTAAMDHGDHDDRSQAAAANDADIAFTAGMIPHHEQAIEMSDIVLGKDGIDPRVGELAERIKTAQGPEIDRLQGWLRDWGAEHAGHGGDHAGHGDGMMTEEDLAALRDASGADASRLFLEQMIAHHEGAVQMAETQIAEGGNADAIALAREIASAQAAEIQQMRDLLASLN